MKQPVKHKRIAVPPSTIPSIARQCGCSITTVWNALSYRTNSTQSQRIRQLATEIYGGVYTTRVTFVECDTTTPHPS